MKCFNDYIVDVVALRSNAQNIKNKIGKDKKFCAVVKANAYGHGLQTVCKALKDFADFFACACLKEALSIRVFDKTTSILILGHIDNDDFELASKNNISISIGSVDQINYLNEHVIEPIKIHLQVNTGMNRFGFRSLTEFNKALHIIEENNNLVLEGVYSHFSTKQNDVKFMYKQYFRFLQFKKFVKDKNVIFHLANSYGILHSDVFHFDMVRSGFLLYGHAQNNIGNKPILRITSKVISVLDCKKGDSIGYDRTYKLSKPTTIAVIPLGYADGFSRRLSNNFKVIINNKKYRVVGRICMDVFMVDVGKDNVNIGDCVIILGKSKSEEITLDDHAKNIDTSNYEVVCGFNYKRMNYVIKNK